MCILKHRRAFFISIFCWRHCGWSFNNKHSHHNTPRQHKGITCFLMLVFLYLSFFVKEKISSRFRSSARFQQKDHCIYERTSNLPQQSHPIQLVYLDSTNIVLCCVTRSLDDGSVSLREGLNNSSVALWKETSIHTSQISINFSTFKSHKHSSIAKMIKIHCCNL